MPRELRRSPVCLNCAAAVASRFCGECGQENTDYRVSFRALVGDAVDELFQLESRLWRSLWHLLRHPGRLTVEYNAGRRVRYTAPIRLYLLCSLTFLFVASGLNRRHVEHNLHGKVRFDVGPVQLSVGPEDPERVTEKPQSRIARLLVARVEEINRLDDAARARLAAEILFEDFPKAIACLVPLFALLLQLLFRGRYYVEHVVFALHLHAVTFLAFLVPEVPDQLFGATNWHSVPAFVFVGWWTLVAIRTVYRQSWWRIAWKLPLLGLLYLIPLLIAIAVASLVGFLSG
jgi:hypothetical protein